MWSKTQTEASTFAYFFSTCLKMEQLIESLKKNLSCTPDPAVFHLLKYCLIVSYSDNIQLPCRMLFKQTVHVFSLSSSGRILLVPQGHGRSGFWLSLRVEKALHLVKP